MTCNYDLCLFIELYFNKPIFTIVLRVEATKNDDSLSLRDGIPDTILEGIYLLKPLADPDSEEDPHEGFVSAEEELKGFFESRQAIPSFRSLVSSLANLRPDFKERDTEARYLAFAAKFERLRKRASHLNLDLPWWMNQFAEKVRPTRIAEDFVERIKAGIQQTFSFPNHSPSNGLVERVNQEVVKLTRKLSTDTANHTDWSDKIPLIQLILNSEPSSTTKLSPYSLLFGRHIKPRRNLLDVLLSRNDTTDKTSNTHSFVDQISKETLKLTSEAIRRKRKTVDATPNEFLVGDLVLLDDAPNKLLNLLGPFQVTKKHGNSGYEIESIVADKKRTVSAYDLHSFSPNILDENAKRLAASDYDEHLVNQVIDHDPKNEWFLVRFSNGVEAWQPLDNLRDGSKINCYLQDYCLKHKLNLTPRKRGKEGEEAMLGQ
ncbi:hypothetical protein GEMRC1_002038 [Eukaryota sp. GEM-RC1]